MNRTLFSFIAVLWLLFTACGTSATTPPAPVAAPSSKTIVSESVPYETPPTSTISDSPAIDEEPAKQSEALSNPQRSLGQLSIAAPKGPTSMGMAKLMDNYSEGGPYHFTLTGSPDELVGGLITGEYDIAAVPVNLAANLYHKTDGGIQLAAINTLGVLYIVEAGETVQCVADLKGRTIYATGQGSTPEYVLNYILESNGLTPGADVLIEYKTEHAELANIMAAGITELALLPQPFVTSALSQNPDLRVALDMTDEWDKTGNGQLTMGCLVTQRKLVEEMPEALDAFLREYRNSVNFIKDEENLQDAAQLMERYDILKASVAEQAIPQCNLTFVRGGKMREIAEGFLQVLFESDAKSVGGEMPNDDFYYGLIEE